jgi:non-specific serine/threonine protein kinase
LITLVGPPGAGKTRLALQLAARLEHDFGGQMSFVPLAGVADPGLVLQVIATRLGVGEGAEQPLLERVATALGQDRTLLLLDNFEHLVQARTCVAALLAACPSLTVLVTSREPLRLSAEQQFVVPPLALPPTAQTSAEPSVSNSAGADGPVDTDPGEYPREYEAVALFVERARAVLPGFTTTTRNVGTLAEICRRLDGLPLAIELAAARSKLLPPAALLARLERRLDLLTDGPRDLPEHQQTLRRAIAWSYNLLSPHEQALLARLAVFVGGWTLDSAHAVAGNEDGRHAEGPWAPSDQGDVRGSVLDGLSSLLDKSLIQRAETPTGEPRFVMLETIREFATERLVGSPAAAFAIVARRHAAYFLEQAEYAAPHLRGPREQEWLDVLELEHGNVRVSLDWCLEHPQPDGVAWALRFCAVLSRFWWVRGHLTEGRARLRQALDLARAYPFAPSPPVVEAHAMTLYGAGLLAKYQGDFAAARAHHEAALGIWKAAGDVPGVGHAVLTLGNTLHQFGSAAEARSLVEAALTSLRAAGDATGAAWAAIHLGGILLTLGEYTAAEPLLEQGLAASRTLGEHVAASWGLRYCGQLACAQGQGQRAAALLWEGLALSATLGDRRQMAQQLESLAEVAASQQDYERAVHLAGTAQRLRRAVGAPLAPVDRARQDTWLTRAESALGSRLRTLWETAASESRREAARDLVRLPETLF